MILVKIAWRNIWRNKTRSLVIITAVAMGLWAGVFVMGFYSGIIDQRINDVIESEVGHFQVHHPQFRDNYQPNFTVSSGQEILDQLSTEEQVKVAAGRVITMAMINSPRNSSGVRIMAIDPEREKSLMKLDEKLVKGEYFSPDRKSPILISTRLAKKLDVELQNKVVMTFQGADKELKSGSFRIVGLYKTINAQFDEMNVFVPRDELAKLLGTGGAVHEIAVLLHLHDQVAFMVKKYADAYPKADVKSWMDLSPGMRYVVDAVNAVMLVIIGIILLALMFGIINTMLMAILERKKELGVLMAIGMNRVRVFLMILLETFFLAIIGAAAGELLGWTTIRYFNKNGIDLSFLSDALAEFGYSSYIYPTLEGFYYWQIGLMVFVMTLIAALPPAISALKLSPTEAIRKI